jgi:hypothetical protein
VLAGVIASRRGACDAKGVSSDRPPPELSRQLDAKLGEVTHRFMHEHVVATKS